MWRWDTNMGSPAHLRWYSKTANVYRASSAPKKWKGSLLRWAARPDRLLLRQYRCGAWRNTMMRGLLVAVRQTQHRGIQGVGFLERRRVQIDHRIDGRTLLVVGRNSIEVHLYQLMTG